MISIFGDGLAGCLVCGFLFGLGVVFCCLVACLVCFPHGRDLLFLLNCDGMGEKKIKEKLLPDVRDTDVEMVDSSSAHQQTDHSESACAW